MLTNKELITIEVPGEDGQYIKARHASIADVVSVAEGESPVLKMLQACIKEWSYDAEVTLENIAALDPKTAMEVYNRLAAGPTAEQTKNSARRSPKP